MNYRFTCLALIPLILVLARSSAAQTVWHVDAAAPAAGDGTSWATAFDELQSALDVATTADRIWVAAGTYHPSARANPTNPRSARFAIPTPLQIYGGFAGTETLLSERNPALFEHTVLSGDLGVQGDPADNAYRLVELSGFPVPGIARLDGFRITGGNAIGNGGAVLAKQTAGGFNPRVTLYHCKLDANHAERGGAIAVENFGVVRLVDCRVENNTATSQGGAVYSFTGGCLAVNTRFTGNTAGTLGGVLFADSSNLGWNVFANCLFSSNRANRGGVAYLRGSSFTAGIADFYNCTLYSNEGEVSGGALHAVTDTATPASARVFNSILWANSAPSEPSIQGPGLDVRFSDVQGGYPGIGNLDRDPFLLVDAHPRLGSPVNDAGSNGLLVNDFLDLDSDGDTGEELPLDFLGRPRRVDDPRTLDTGAGLAPVVDLGAYESTRATRREVAGGPK
jgi:hypothetical protein